MNSTPKLVDPSLLNHAKADKAMKLAGRIWFLVAFIGLWLFACYIIAFYGGTAIKGDFKSWNDAMYHGLMEGDWVGNFMLAMHLFLAFIITVGGTLQLIPQVRKYSLPFHRWNGRIYIVTAFLISIAGLYMVWTRGVIGGAVMATGNTLNASLIMICSALTWRFARVGDIDKHRLWAIRTFLVVSGVWFIRVGYGMWILINFGSAPGSTEMMEGPFDRFLAIGHTVLPLAIFELYLRVQNRAGTTGKFVMAGALFLVTLLMAAGLGLTTMIFWYPQF